MISYYGELCTQYYESDKSIAGGKELDFYLSFADKNDMTVLEPMCGNGRMLIPDYHFNESSIVEKTEYMEYALRLYEIDEFRQILLLNGFTEIQLHEVTDGYGEGSRFVVFECSIDKE